MSSFKEEIMSEYQKDVLFLCGAVLIGIIYICVGLFAYPSGTEDQMVFIGSGIMLLAFCAWFLFDLILRYR